MTWYSFFRSILEVTLPAIAPVRVEGSEHVPAEGPFILVPNHQSVLDPLLVQTSVERNDIFTLTKSTQFDSAFFGWLLPRTRTIPVRRFRVDPQAVRVILRRLDAGHGVCIYPEGERSWDGSIQPLQHGSGRVILKAGVPVVPCGVAGSFDVWPRWTRRMRRGEVRIRFGEPLEFGRHDDRDEREARLDETLRTIRRALAELSGAPLARPVREAAQWEPVAERSGARSGPEPAGGRDPDPDGGSR